VDQQVTDQEIKEAFGSTHISEDVDGKRALLAESVLKVLAGYSTGYTLAQIMEEMKLARGTSVLKRGRQFLWAFYGEKKVAPSKEVRACHVCGTEEPVNTPPHLRQVLNVYHYKQGERLLTCRSCWESNAAQHLCPCPRAPSHFTGSVCAICGSRER